MPRSLIYTGVPADFASGAFYDYCRARENYRLDVYLDVKGNPTVGIGHLVTSSDNLAVGDVITPEQCQAFFDADYQRLNVYNYVAESTYTLNTMLCIGHFIWMHGDHAYAISQYRQHWLNDEYPNEATMQQYLAANWDLASTKVQAQNAYDCHTAYLATDWTPGLSSLGWQFTEAMPTLSGWVQDYQVPLTVLLVLLLVVLVIVFVYKQSFF